MSTRPSRPCAASASARPPRSRACARSRSSPSASPRSCSTATARVLGPSISWLTAAARPRSQDVCARVGRERLYAITGVAPDGGSTLASLAWLRRHAPATLEAARRLRSRRTGVFRLRARRAPTARPAAAAGLLEIATCTGRRALRGRGRRPGAPARQRRAARGRVGRLGPRPPAARPAARTRRRDRRRRRPGGGARRRRVAPRRRLRGTGTASSWRIAQRRRDAGPDGAHRPRTARRRRRLGSARR